ncbi:MAG: CRTAC1 family protein [Nannocystaceae bacterium]|nr:CRTAC1 family protein [bacterium]
MTYDEVARAVGVDVVHQSIDPFTTQGVAWGDFDVDGVLDMVVTSHGAPNRSFRGVRGSTFEVAPWDDAAALPTDISTGAVVVDYDNDSWPDLFVMADGPNTLLRNAGDGALVDVTQAAGLGDAGFGQTAAWGDYDGDGLLDVYIANYETELPDRLMHNDGGGVFSDANEAFPIETRTRLGFTASFFDYDLDGDVDLYVVNDKFGGNVLWRNDGPGCGGTCWVDVSASSGAGVQMEGMGLAVGDYDNDGDQDLFITNIGPMVLLQNQAAQGVDSFVDVSAEARALVDDNDWGQYGWGAQFVDYDNDGWLDLYVALGRVGPGPELPNAMLRNRGDGTFQRVPSAAGAEDQNRSQGLAVADYDADGWVDLLVGNANAPFALFRNRGADANWLEVELHGDGDVVSRDAVGSRISVVDERGHAQVREIIAGSSLGAGSSLRQHFGLGSAAPTSLTIRWPNGAVHTVEDVATNALVRVEYE